MNRRALLIVPVLLLACERQPVAPDTELAPAFAAVSEWEDLNLVYPEGDGFINAWCIDDPIDEIGTWIRLRHRVIRGDGVIVSIHWQLGPGDDYVLRGTNTGDWLPVPGDHDVVTTTRTPDFHQSWLSHYVMKNAVTGVVLDWPIRYHITTNANGEVTVEKYAEPCTIRQDK